MGFETRIDINKYENENGNVNVNVNGNGNSTIINGFCSSSSSSPRRYIEHHVTKMDTLAGVAIRYGVEISDVKKLNGLVSDLQMFALKTLQIPLTGRYPPTPCLSSGHSSEGPSSCNQTPPRRRHSDLEPFQSLRLTPDRKLSPAMCSLRDFYGLNGGRNSSEGCEMAFYGKGYSTYQEDGSSSRISTSSSMMNSPLSQPRRSRSVANGFRTDEDESSKKIEGDYNRTPEKFLKEENGSGGWSSTITGKGLALRTKAGSRTNLCSEVEPGNGNGFPSSFSDSISADSSSGVRKSSSTPSFQEQDGNGGLSIWSASKWSLKPDLQAALSNTIFDGLPKPITGRKSKAALD